MFAAGIASAHCSQPLTRAVRLHELASNQVAVTRLAAASHNFDVPGLLAVEDQIESPARIKRFVMHQTNPAPRNVAGQYEALLWLSATRYRMDRSLGAGSKIEACKSPRVIE